MNLSVLEQSPRLRSLYTQLCFCYSLDHDGVSLAEITTTVRGGLARLTRSFPWIAGQVVCDGETENDPGTFKIIPFEEIPIVVVRHLEGEGGEEQDEEQEEEQEPGLTFAGLQKARFPFSMLDERIICPRLTLPSNPEQAVLQSAPVFLLQINLIKGGLLLTILASHGTMDIAGQVQMIKLLSKACHNLPFTDSEISEGNLDRRNLIPLLNESDQTNSQSPERKVNTATPLPSASREREALVPPAKAFEWAYFSFHSEALKELKKLVQSSVPAEADFVSTDDALCALIWLAVGRARLQRLPATTNTNLTRQVDMRRYLRIPQGYPGNMVTQTKNTCTLHELGSKSLGKIAYDLRSALQPDALVYNIRAQATEQQVHANQRNSSTKSPRDRSQDVVISSWSKAECHQVDFNLGLGAPVAVRRPMFTPVEGVVYFLPKALDGEIVIGLCLQSEDMLRLRHDDEFLKHASYIG